MMPAPTIEELQKEIEGVREDLRLRRDEVFRLRENTQNLHYEIKALKEELARKNRIVDHLVEQQCGR